MRWIDPLVVLLLGLDTVEVKLAVEVQSILVVYLHMASCAKRILKIKLWEKDILIFLSYIELRDS